MRPKCHPTFPWVQVACGWILLRATMGYTVSFHMKKSSLSPLGSFQSETASRLKHTLLPYHTADFKGIYRTWTINMKCSIKAPPCPLWLNIDTNSKPSASYFNFILVRSTILMTTFSSINRLRISLLLEFKSSGVFHSIDCMKWEMSQCHGRWKGIECVCEEEGCLGESQKTSPNQRGNKLKNHETNFNLSKESKGNYMNCYRP